jgi:hypothetical protein
MSKECKHCGFVAKWMSENCWCGALSNPEKKPTHPENMKAENKLDMLFNKVDELQKQLNQQNGYIIDQTLIIQKLIEKLVVIPSVPVSPNIDPHFGKDIPYVPYKGPDCENRTTTPIKFKSYDGTLSTLPVNTLPDREWYG